MGLCPLQAWQVDYVAPLPQTAGKQYLFTEVDTTTGLGFAWPTPTASQKDSLHALEQLSTMYGWPLTISSDRGTHFTGQRAQQWAKEQDIEWQLHVPYRPQAAGMGEHFNGLLKEKLRALGGTSPWKQRASWVPLALHLLNEQP